MYSQGVKLIYSEWKLFMILIISIMALSTIPLFINIYVLNIFLFLIGLDLLYGYLIVLSKKLKNDPIENDFKEIFSGKDKKRLNFLLIFIFFGAIILLLKAPFYLFLFITEEKISKVINSSISLPTTLNLLVIFLFATYKTVLYGAIANFSYYGNEVLESFKAGIKCLTKSKAIILIIAIYDFVISFLPLDQKPTVFFIIQLTQHIIPAILTTIILTSYNPLSPVNKTEELDY